MKLESAANKWHWGHALLFFGVIGILYAAFAVAILAWPKWWMFLLAVPPADRHQWSALLLGESAKVVFALSAGATIFLASANLSQQRLPRSDAERPTRFAVGRLH